MRALLRVLPLVSVLLLALVPGPALAEGPHRLALRVKWGRSSTVRVDPSDIVTVWLNEPENSLKKTKLLRTSSIAT